VPSPPCCFCGRGSAAGAAEYVVGDVAFGWDSGINYAAWARDHAFAVGDVLGQQPPLLARSNATN